MVQIRLQKYISDAGIMSRRAAEREIEAGNITVNGKTVELGTKIDPVSDTVQVNGRIIEKKSDKKVYILLNKPCGYVTTMKDEKGRKCVSELTEDVGERVYPVGRLDMNSEGLLIMTNDGELANKLMHPSSHVPKIYHARVSGDITDQQLSALSSSMDIDGYMIKPVKCTVLRRDNGKTTIEMTLYEGRNRQIRKMCENTGIELLRLRRIAIGEIRLGNIKAGTWRYMTREQIYYIKNV